MKLKSLLSVLLCTVMMSANAVACNSHEDATPGNPVSSEDTAPADTASHAVRLLYMGQASIRILTEEGKVIYIDPYAGNDYSLPADLILVTHEHFDHNAIDKVERCQSDCRIIRSRDAIIGGEHQTFDLGYVRVEAVEAEFNRLHDVDDCVGYVLTFNNGKKVYVSGDTSTTDQMHEMAGMRIDYAFLCSDGVYNMENEEAARAAELIKARHNIPYHNSTTNRGEMFDHEAAERVAAPDKMIVLPGETITIE